MRSRAVAHDPPLRASGFVAGTHRRKDRLVRTSPLLYIRDGDDFVLVGTTGAACYPSWTANLLAHPQAHIEVAQVRVAVEAELVDQVCWTGTGLASARSMRATPGTGDWWDRVPRMFLLHPAA